MESSHSIFSQKKGGKKGIKKATNGRKEKRRMAMGAEGTRRRNVNKNSIRCLDVIIGQIQNRILPYPGPKIQISMVKTVRDRGDYWIVTLRRRVASFDPVAMPA
ncbi:predicted protein [Histoplasma capsulatum G186AR]|uniref:Uncharacterized protein n=1 Tax=Ajellomyces capsulatus (strain G186AR / H82 / ATCC MYA-2454 / RMSCC 2432) TaxID=447093 RepID=C0NGN6_AJECG|nr:uncharacterized protein HCBG_02508 [Histoplasma capsulatum G186AR]EEH08971.1 predicted protein [Histoplasma capsulatum G186AR]